MLRDTRKRTEVPLPLYQCDLHSSGDDVEWIGYETLQEIHATTASEKEIASLHADSGPEENV